MASSTKTDKELYNQATAYTTALLLPRILLLIELMKIKEIHEALPYYWLLLQIKAPILLHTPTGYDLFLEAWNIFKRCRNEDLINQIKIAMKALQLYENIFCFIDEAQILLSSCENCLSNTPAPLSLLSPMVASLVSLPSMNIILSGTGLGLKNSLNATTETELAKYLIVDFGLYNDIQSMHKYVGQFIEITEQDMRSIFNVLRGKPQL